MDEQDIAEINYIRKIWDQSK